MVGVCTLILIGALAFWGTADPASAATNYQLWIGGTQVTSDNCNSNSTWSFDNSTKTLTLKSYSYSGKGYTIKEDGDAIATAAIYAKMNLKISLEGSSSVTSTRIDDCDTAGIWVDGNLTISGSGSLKATGGANTDCESYGILVYDGNLTQESGQLTCTGGKAYNSYGIYGLEDEDISLLTLNGGTLTAKGGALSTDAEEDCTSTGIYVTETYMNGGTLNATGGDVTTGASYGIDTWVEMTGGSFNATGGKAPLESYGWESQCGTISSGSMTFAGGTSDSSYGVHSFSDDPSEVVLVIVGDATVTATGNTSGTNGMFSFTESDFDDEGDEGEDDSVYQLINGFYINTEGYTPAFMVSANVNGSDAQTFVAPDPEDTFYTDYKYVHVRPATRPTSLTCTPTTINSTTAGEQIQLNVQYIPADVELKYAVFSSSNLEAATVDAEGKIEIIASGSAVITAANGDASATCQVTADIAPIPDPIVTSGKCGSSLQWTLYESGLLTIEGSGAMYDYGEDGAPWLSYNNLITEVQIDENCTSIGANTFRNLEALDTISFSSKLKSIGESAFEGCPNLSHILFEVGFESLGDRAFANCPNLVSAYFDGDAPQFGVDVFVGCSEGFAITHAEGRTGWDEVPGEPHTHDYKGYKQTMASFDEPDQVIIYCSYCGKVMMTSPGWTVEAELEQTEYTYTGEPIYPEVTVEHNGNALTKGKDYQLYYGVNTAVGSQTGSVAVFLQGDHYTGVKFLYFDIAPMPIKQAVQGKAHLDEDTFIYDGTKKKPNLIWNNPDKALTEGVDYNVTYTGDANQGTKHMILYGKGNYTDSYIISYTIKPSDISDRALTLSEQTFVYNGAVQLPTIDVEGLTYGEDYGYKILGRDSEVLGSYSIFADPDKDFEMTKTDVGNYDIEVESKGNYSGTLKSGFTICPKGTALRTVKSGKAGSHSMTVKWKRQKEKMSTAGINGYQVQYSTDKAFTKNVKNKTIKRASATSKKIAKLKNKKYFVRVRTFMKVNGEPIYSPWSNPKKVKIK